MSGSKRQPDFDLGGVLLPRKTPLKPPESYIKKILNPGGDCPLILTYTRDQVDKRIAFYRELNAKRERMPRGGRPVEKSLALYGWEDTTTVRVYLRETVTKIAQELFVSNCQISVENVREGEDKDHGYVLVSVRATATEIHALVGYIRPGASFFVYDGEESRYVAGNTAASEFIVTKVDDPVHPTRYWRRSQSFIAAMEEVAVGYSTFPFASQ
jgi:hypothetical protein